MFNDSVRGSETSAQACQSAVQSQCQFSGASSIEAPSNCVTEDAQGNKELISSISSRDAGTETNGVPDINCPSNNNP
jgi:hypothetical protein